jgi:hypothetical protein
MSIVKYNNNSISDVTSGASLASGAMTHIKTIVSSNDDDVSFVHGSSDVVFDSTYPIYVFKFINIHPNHDDQLFKFSLSSDSGSNYNVSITSTVYYPLHAEGDGSASLQYHSSMDLANSTSGQQIARAIGSGNDESFSGTLTIFNPSSTTFVKHFLAEGNEYMRGDETRTYFVAGYANTTSAIDAIKFEIGSPYKSETGTIKLYGIKDS